VPEFSDYIVYVDESGDHSLYSINPQFPVFVLAFCLIRKDDYLSKVVPDIQALKFHYFGHDMVLLHESEIRKSRGPFNILLNQSVRERFLSELSTIIEEAPFILVASCIKKHDYVAQWGTDGNPCSKQTNSAGLQLADMVARPIGRHLIDPTQSNRAFDTLEKKLRRNSQGKVQGLGLKVYP
jgi:Protein of unknown function (DUF3800)